MPTDDVSMPEGLPDALERIIRLAASDRPPSSDEALAVRHAALVVTDGVVGLQATIARLETELASARAHNQRLRRRVDSLEATSRPVSPASLSRIGRRLLSRRRRSSGQ